MATNESKEKNHEGKRSQQRSAVQCVGTRLIVMIRNPIIAATTVTVVIVNLPLSSC